MKKLVLVLSVVFVTLSSFATNNEEQYEELPTDRWCFNTWSFVYNQALAQGGTTAAALDLASAAFDTCVENQQ